MRHFPHFEPHFPRSQWTLPLVLAHQAQVLGDKPFLQWTADGQPISYAEAERRSNRFARGLARIGVGFGDRVVLMLPNSLDYVFAWFAINKLGAVEAPINVALKGAFFEHQANISAASTIIIDAGFAERLRESLPNMPRIARIIVSGDPGALDLPKGWRGEVYALADLYDADDSAPDVRVRPQDLAAIMYTSGTTGPSKGVLMPHAQTYLFSEESAQLVGLGPDDSYFIGLPLFHANAQFLCLYPCMIAGARCVLYDRFSASEWLSQARRSGATVTNTLGVMLPFVYGQPARADDREHGVRRVFSVPGPHEKAAAYRERFGIEQFHEAFGQTEICLPFMTPPDAEPPQGSCGLLVDQWFDVRLADPETDEEVAVGEVGELLVRPKLPWTINAGYAAMPEKTAEAYRNLWFHTGDGLRRDADGWYYFVDRLKDALRRRGENISSFEVEAPIRQHPAVADVAVIGVPAEEGGEDEVKACIVLRSEFTLDPEALVAWCEERMPYFAVPRYIEFLDNLPRTQSEKIQKGELRAAGVTDATWDRVKAGYQLKEELARKQKRGAAQ